MNKKTADKIKERPIVEEMQTSYLDYAMSVIVSRALPDVRDGLKPVHRRILYAMWLLGLKANAKFRKSATVVGEVLGKYHPHGDAAVYDSLARLVQDFSMRYPLINGQGNFGSIDGDSPAAMRYTEAKLETIAEEMLDCLEKETVDFRDNYDGTEQEPSVLPSKLPNLLLNGTLGIAVGMATNIPPHNLTELCNGLIYLIENPEAGIADLMKFIKGPDFPTGSLIFDKEEITKAYATGKGSIVMRAKTKIVETKKGNKIIVDELPYQVNKASLIEKIASLVKNDKIKGIKRIIDESDRNGLRISIDLKKDSYPKKVLNQLYKFSRLQDTFHVNMVALIDGIQPRVLNLKTILEEYIKHRQEIVKRRTKFDLKQAKAREHILVGLVIALENIDEIIATIKKSKNRQQAKKNLIKRFKLSKKQAKAILRMRLQALAGLERLRVEKELKEKRELIKQLEAILKSPKKVLNIIKKELQEIKEKYGDERKTTVFNQAVNSISQKDLIPKESAVIMITNDGYIKRLSPKSFKSQARGGKGVIGLTRKEEDKVSHLLSTNTHSNLLFFTDSGKVFQLKTFDVPETSRTARGQAVVNFLELKQNENVTAILSRTETNAETNANKYLVMATEKGIVKKVKITKFHKVRRSGLIAIKLKKDDQLKWIKAVNKNQEIMLSTAKGLAIRFKESELRPMGRNAQGVIGIKLSSKDKVVGMDIIKDKNKQEYLLSISENGYGKMSSINKYRLQSRAGKGVKTMNTTKKTGLVTSSQVICPKQLPKDKKGDLILISQKGQVIRIKLNSIPIQGRSTQGVRLMRLKEKKDSVAQVALI